MYNYIGYLIGLSILLIILYKFNSSGIGLPKLSRKSKVQKEREKELEKLKKRKHKVIIIDKDDKIVLTYTEQELAKNDWVISVLNEKYALDKNNKIHFFIRGYPDEIESFDIIKRAKEKKIDFKFAEVYDKALKSKIVGEVLNVKEQKREQTMILILILILNIAMIGLMFFMMNKIGIVHSNNVHIIPLPNAGGTGGSTNTGGGTGTGGGTSGTITPPINNNTTNNTGGGGGSLIPPNP